MLRGPGGGGGVGGDGKHSDLENVGYTGSHHVFEMLATSRFWPIIQARSHQFRLEFFDL